MIGSGPSQKAGENAVQIQIQGDFVQQGVTEERALAIAREAAKKVVDEYSEESHALGLQRIEEFDQILIERLAQAEKLAAFADPGFQIALRKAQIGAASTERADDYKVLAELLADRVQNRTMRLGRAGIDRAIEIVDKVDDEALLGLTLFHVMSLVRPIAPEINTGIRAMEEVFDVIIGDSELPMGRDWLDHLDILDAIRTDRIQSFHPFDTFYSKKMTGYMARGVDPQSSDYGRILEEASTNNFRLNVLQHELKPGFLRLAYASFDRFSQGLDATPGISEERRAVATRIAKEDFGLTEEGDESLKPLLLAKALEFPQTRRVHDWWSQLPSYFYATSVGKVLARANAERCDHKQIIPTKAL